MDYNTFLAKRRQGILFIRVEKSRTPAKGWTIRFLMGGGLCKSPKKYRACACGLKKIPCIIVKKEKNIEQP